MKLFLKITSTLLLSILLFITWFYYWGSSPRLDPKEYLQLIQYANNTPPKSRDTLTIMTYNIGWLSAMTNNLPVDRPKSLYDESLAEAVQLIKTENADIIGFQEIDYGSDRSYNVNQLDTLAKLLNYGNASMAVNWDMNYVPFPYFPFKYHFGKMLSGEAILSRLNIQAHKRYVLSKPLDAPFWYKKYYLDRVLQVTEINVSKKMYVFNVHLEAFDVKTREVQADEVVAILQPLVKDFPVIFMGDFNAIFSNQNFYNNDLLAKENTLLTITQKLGLRDVVESNFVFDKSKSFGTYPADNPSEKIDHIFVNDKIDVLSWHVPTKFVGGSDHRPLLAKIVIKK